MHGMNDVQLAVPWELVPVHVGDIGDFQKAWMQKAHMGDKA